MVLTKMAVPVVLLLCLAAFYSTASADLLSEYAHHAVLDPAEKMKLYWTVDWDAKTVSFAVEAETTGWVEFGFSNGSGQMIGSDVVLGWIKDNKGYLTDRFVTSESIPPIDKQQDYKLTGSQESGGKTVLKFTRKFDTCDPQDRKLEKGATNVVYAYGTEDPVSPMNMKKEVDKGSKSVLLLNKMDRRNVDKTGWTKFTITANVTIPANETTYWCTAVNGPKLTSKHHITAFEPIIKAGNEDLVHHYIVYGCHGGFTENDFHGGVNCFGTEKVFTKCKQRHMIIVWTVGGEAFYLPQHVGVPIGGNDSPTSFLLQIAYDNPTNINGRRDSSGVMLYYTDQLRKYEGGVVSTGVDINDWQIIPPKQENWISTGYCMHQCTEDMFKSTSPKLPGGGIKIFATLIHIHSTGRAAWTKHVRDGKELPEIARLNTYDFKYQDTQILTETQEVHIQPGDDLIHQCKYDSMKRNKLTKGGFFIQDEMCLDFLFYYPRISGLSLCRSTSYEPSKKLLDKYFNLNITASPKINPLAHLDFDWNSTMIADFRKYESDVNAVVPRCLMKNLTTVADIAKFNLPIPEITEPLPAEKSDCPKEATSPAPVSSQPHSASALFFGTLCAVVGALQ